VSVFRLFAVLGCPLLFCGVVTTGCAQSLPATSEKSVSYSAPLELIHDKPFVSVMVNGRGPYRFLVDTGTGGQALITPELAQQLSLSVVGHAKLTDPSGLGQQRSDIMRIESLNIAGAEFSDVDAVVHNLYGDESCHGVLGFTLFEDYLLTLDFPGHRMVLANGDLDSDADGSVLPFRMPDGVPIVHLNIDQQDFEAQIDSGGTGLSVPSKDSAELKFQQPPVDFANGESVSTKFQIKAARLQSDVMLGRYTFKEAFIEINSAFPLVNIGSTPLQHFVITFDQVNDLVRLYSSEDTLHLDASPVFMELLNQPKREASDHKLVPVG
jgi:hypothetical protein